MNLPVVRTSTMRPKWESAKIGQSCYLRGWPTYSPASQHHIVTAIGANEVTITTFQRPSRGWARRVRKIKAGQHGKRN